MWCTFPSDAVRTASSAPVALKIFSPAPYADVRSYEEDIARIAHIAASASVAQHDNLVDVHNFFAIDGIRVMALEYLEVTISAKSLPKACWTGHAPVSLRSVWTTSIESSSPMVRYNLGLKPGVAIQILRECLSGLAALHSNAIVHGDLKPSNVMSDAQGTRRSSTSGLRSTWSTASHGGCGRPCDAAFAPRYWREGRTPRERISCAPGLTFLWKCSPAGLLSTV